jgi:uncharacterized membrane protein YsdA (DUF1294 family)
VPTVSALGPIGLTVLGAYVALSAASFVMYGLDKAAAEQGRWRTPEVVLHMVSVAGGWPGALVGQRVFRHKTRKQPFRAIFWCTVVANCLALAWLLVRVSAVPV